MVYVNLKSPKSVTSQVVAKQILKHLENGYTTNEIGWRMEFVTTEALVMKVADKFRAVKNIIAFRYRNNKNK